MLDSEDSRETAPRRCWPSRRVLLAVLGDERFDELGNFVLLAARQRGHDLEDLANPPIGSGIPAANRASSQQAVGRNLQRRGQRFDWIGRQRNGFALSPSHLPLGCPFLARLQASP